MSRTALLALLVTAGIAGADDSGPLSTVESVDLERYAGKWYEIARLPTRFQKDCVAATAEYEPSEPGRVKVVNTCYREDGTTRDIEGEARTVDDSNARLVVKFDGFFFKLFSWLIKADYWVIDLHEEYDWAVVGTPNRSYLWILAREPSIDQALYDELVDRAAAQGFEVERLVRSRAVEP